MPKENGAVERLAALLQNASGSCLDDAKGWSMKNAGRALFGFMERLGVPRQIVAFVMPTGYSFNLDGSTLYLSLAAIFVTQAAGIHLPVGQQLVLLLTLMLTSKGVAGVPRGALVILLATVSSFGLPAEPVFIILGIDQLMDMLRTSLNVVGNCLATVVIARWEGEFDDAAAGEAGPAGRA